MKINVTFEVNNKNELVEILRQGSAHSLLDYKIIDFDLNPVFTVRQQPLSGSDGVPSSPKSASQTSDNGKRCRTFEEE